MKKIIPYKDRWSRGTILGLGIVLLLLLNGLFFVILKTPNYLLGYILLICLIGLIYWRKGSEYSKLSYMVDSEQIQIYKGTKLLKTIARKDITSIEHNQHLSVWSSNSLLFQKFFPRGVYQYADQYHARLALTGLTKIETYKEVVWLSGGRFGK